MNLVVRWAGKLGAFLLFKIRSGKSKKKKKKQKKEKGTEKEKRKINKKKKWPTLLHSFSPKVEKEIQSSRPRTRERVPKA